MIDRETLRNMQRKYKTEAESLYLCLLSEDGTKEKDEWRDFVRATIKIINPDCCQLVLLFNEVTYTFFGVYKQHKYGDISNSKLARLGILNYFLRRKQTISFLLTQLKLDLDKAYEEYNKNNPNNPINR